MAVMAATVGTAVAAGTAQAATLTITPDKPCYMGGEKADVKGTGFTPNGAVHATFAGILKTFPVDATGAFGAQLSFPGAKGVKALTMKATDATDPAITASLHLKTATLHVDVSPKHATAGKKLRVKGFGLVGGKKVYMHVRGPHHYRTDAKVARTKGACGTFETRRRLVPAGVRSGLYTVWFDAKKKFSRKTRPRAGVTLTVFRTVG
jgi:hypothetical protein